MSNLKILAILMILFINKQSFADLSWKFNFPNLKKTNEQIIPKLEGQKTINNQKIPESPKEEIKNSNEIRLKIGGMIESQFSHMDQLSIFDQMILPNQMPGSLATGSQNGGNLNHNRISVKSRIDFNPEFINHDTKIKFGAFLSTPLMANNLYRNNDPKIASQEYLYFELPFGKIEFGSTYSSASKMRIDPQKIASGTGGVYGDWWRYVAWPIFGIGGISADDGTMLNAMSPIFMMYPTLPNEAGFTYQNYLTGNNIIMQNNSYYPSNMQGYPTQGARSNKISFYTKRIYGFQFGYSFSPTTADTGYATRMLNTNSFSNIIGGYVQNYMSFALNYKKQINDDFGIAGSITHEIGQVHGMNYLFIGNSSIDLTANPNFQRRDLNATAYGIQATYKNFAISYSYGDWRGSLLTPLHIISGQYNITYGSQSNYHVVGAAVNYGPITVGTNYMRTNFSGNETEAISLGTDIKINSIQYMKVQPFFEFTWYRFIPKSINLIAGSSDLYKSIANKGYVLLTGVRMQF